MVARVPRRTAATSPSARSATTHRREWSSNQIELFPRHHALPVDDPFLDHLAGGGRRPIDRARICTFFANLADAALGHAEIAQPLHGPFDAGRAERLRPHGSHRHHEIDLRPLNVRAIEPEERLAGVDVLTGRVDEEVFDVAVRSQGDDRLPAFVVHHGADRPYGPH